MWSRSKSFQRHLARFFKYKHIKSLHLELTTRCKLACRRCDRTFVVGNHPYKNQYPYAYQGPQVNPKDLFNPKSDLTLAIIKKIVPKQSTFKIFISGNYGDPIYHPEIIEILDYLIYSTKTTKVDLTTNGSGMSEEFWKNFRDVIFRDKIRTDKKFRMTFSIDGLEDTNKIYRKGSQWNTILTALHSLKGFARTSWKFIVFRHNEHQISEAKRLSIEYGFEDISFVQSNRYSWWWAGGDPDLLMSPEQHEADGDPLKPTIDVEQKVLQC